MNYLVFAVSLKSLPAFSNVEFHSKTEFNFLSPDKMSGRSDVTPGKRNIRSDIRQNIFEKNQNIKTLCGS